MAQVILELSANEKKLIQSYREAIKVDGELRKSVDKTGDSGKKAGKKIADGMIAGAKAASEGVKKELGAGLTDVGKKEIQGLIKILRTMGPEGRKSAQALSRHLAVAGRDGVESIDDIVKEIEKIDSVAARNVGKARKEFATLSGAKNKVVGPKGMSMVGEYAARWVSVAGAISLVAQAMNKVRETNAKALDALGSNKDGDKRLLQVSNSAEDFQAMRGRADSLAREHGISRDAARNLMFSGRSEGFEGSAGFIASNSQVLDVESQATVAGQIPGLFTSETLSPEQAINMTLAGAQASRLDFGQIARSLPSAAEGGALAGASSEETIATLSVLAGRFKSGETAADRMKAFATKVGMDEGGGGVTAEDAAAKQATEDKRVDSATKEKRRLTERRDDIAKDLEAERKKVPQSQSQKESKEKRIKDLETDLARADRGVSEFDDSRLNRKTFSASAGRSSLKGQGLIKAVESLMGMSDDDRKDFLGDSQEVNAAYTIMVEELAAIKDRQDVITDARASTGTSASPTAIKRGAASSDPKLAALKKQQRAEIAREIEEENRRGIDEATRVTDRDAAIAGAEARGENKIKVAGAEMVADAANFAGFGQDGAGALPALLGDELSIMAGETSNALGRNAFLGSDKAVTGQDRKNTESMLLAMSQLGKRRKNDPNAILSQQDTATYLSGVTGDFIEPTKITPGQQTTLTREVIEAAKAGNESYAFTPQGKSDVVVGQSNEVAMEMLKTLSAIQIAIENGTRANQQTADNTKNRGADPALVIQAAGNQ